MTPYADTADLETWSGTTPAPTNAEQLLRSATVLVAQASGRNPYTDDAPTGAVADALRDATTAQAAAWIAAGITPTAGGLDGAVVKEKKLGPADITYETSGQAEARVEAATSLVEEARAILYTAGLLLVDLPVWTSSDDRLLDYGLADTWPTVVTDRNV